MDGLNGRLHGDPANAARDRKIRGMLESMDHTVFVVTAKDLDDKGAMKRHFYDIALRLTARGTARTLREQADGWFSAEQ